MRQRPHDTASAGAEPHRTVWSGHATNRLQWLLAAAGAACLALGIRLAVEAPWTSALAPLVMAVVGCLAAGLLVLFGTLAFVHVAVRIDHEAVRIRCGHVGVPRRNIPFDDITGAEFLPRVTPCHWGGWGCRWRPEKGTAVVVRRGEGMVLWLRGGRTLTVTVDGAESAVRVIRERLGMNDLPGHQAQV